jgi:uracil-DNA glycosylase family 4
MDPAVPSVIAASTVLVPDDRGPEVARSRSQEIGALDWGPLQEQVASCTACGLCRSRSRTVFGVGALQARWMLIGEAPGAEEDARGEPFVGRAGQLLDAMLSAIGLDRRQQVYIANVLKCRPPRNRDPLPDEVAACEPFLQRQLSLVSPAIVLVLGRFAAQAMLGTDASIASLRGRVHHKEVSGVSIPLVVTYHPAYLLRTPADKAKVWADLLLARRTMRDQDN